MKHPEKNNNTTIDPAVPYGSQAAPISDQEFEEIIRHAIDTYGKDAQIKMLFEEMAELQDALCKHSRGRSTNADVCEEIADVMIMCMQMAQIFGQNEVECFAQFKIKRLKERLKGGDK